MDIRPVTSHHSTVIILSRMVLSELVLFCWVVYHHLKMEQLATSSARQRSIQTFQIHSSNATACPTVAVVPGTRKLLSAPKHRTIPTLSLLALRRRQKQQQF